jgi:hypothetical protein
MGQDEGALIAVERCLTEATAPEVREAALALREGIVNRKK